MNEIVYTATRKRKGETYTVKSSLGETFRTVISVRLPQDDYMLHYYWDNHSHLEIFPELELVGKLHGSDPFGLPFRAVEDGWFHLSGYYGGAGESHHHIYNPEECLKSWADLVRVDVPTARFHADTLLMYLLNNSKTQLERWSKVKEEHGKIIDRMKIRWQYEAYLAIPILKALASIPKT